MKNTFILLLLTMIVMTAAAQPAAPVYDKELAASLGADEYGMKMYVLVILKSGSNTTMDKTTLDSLFAGHMENIGRLAKDNKLIVSGPLATNDKAYRGIFIFNVKTIEEAQALVATDPAIKAKIFDVELFRWYGSAALPEYLKIHEKIGLKKP